MASGGGESEGFCTMGRLGWGREESTPMGEEGGSTSSVGDQVPTFPGGGGGGVCTHHRQLPDPCHSA